LLVAAVGGTAAGISLLELTCDAFARLRKASQASGRPLKVIAEAVVETLTGEA